ncbi:hypothetical protein RDWZM_005956 [Blomia tropicalis]|uniref:Uncharacterized protein n=1 Tax=Blomia tropicalis TaxID=40697 RepID=A0A9Q0M700_BLOTA|nr:hypothetical protein RDWZM_005956 [Blomia tropicalis]
MSETIEIPPAKRQLKIFFHSLEAAGHQNSCIGLAQILLRRGHRVIFLLTDQFKGHMTKYGFEEISLTNAKPIEKPSSSSEQNANDKKIDPIKETAEFILSSGLLGTSNSLEKLHFIASANFTEGVYEKVIEYEPQIKHALKQENPDLIIMDHYLISPAFLSSNIPYVMVFSGAPLYLFNSDKLPPPCSGISINSDPSTWIEHRDTFYNKYCTMINQFQMKLNKHFGYVPSEDLESKKFLRFHQSPYMNIYGYPKEIEFLSNSSLPDHYVQVDAFCRDEDVDFQLPEKLALKDNEKLLYVSMGSMGSIDVSLMKRILAVLEQTPHKYIVSKGIRADEYELPSNCWGKASLPQTAILKLVDAAIIHGGNNSFTECFVYGKPMIVMPLFGDQYDNGQRVMDTGYGISMDPYKFEPEQLVKAIDQVLNDDQLRTRFECAAERIKRDRSKEKACLKIEELVN